MNGYKQFLETKQIVDQKSGFKIPLSKLNTRLFDWQKVITQWAIHRGRAALFEGCGLGKTLQQLEWANQIHRKEKEPILILAPLAVSEQTCREGKKFNIKVNLCKSNADICNGINITNYEKLHKFNPDRFIGIVLDECFAPDTPIDIFNIDNSLGLEYIKDISIGDKIYNAGEVDYVHNICKRPVDRAIQIRINGRKFTCSENHPWFTLYGWRFAKDLRAGDRLMATEEAVRLVRSDFSTKVLSQQNGEILRDILLCEMEDACPRAQRKSPYKGNTCKNRQKEVRMVSKRESGSIEGIGKGRQYEPDSKIYKEDGFNQNAEWNSETMERGKRREWPRPNNTTTDNSRFSIRKLANGIYNIFRQKTKRLSNLLQGRPGQSRSKNSNRNRWMWPYEREAKNERQKERRKTHFTRVESVEVLEQGHPELEKHRDANGNIYFYDIEAKQHPSFSIDGCLVHNSGILKNFAGATRNEIINTFQKTPYRLACTATPAPNDYIELGNHSEFLGVMSRSEMLATFFINDTKDTGTWRLKGHVQNNIFWKWMSSWSVMISKPSDIGFKDGDFLLPDIEYHEHILKSTAKPKNRLLLMPARDLNERRKVRQETVEVRSGEAAALINKTNDKWICWCNLNAESETMVKKVTDAVEVAGKHSEEIKINRMTEFAIGNIKRIVTKPKIAGHGMNWQICNKVAFIGLNDSWEAFYQAVRRAWRFGQKKKVDIHVFIEEREESVLKNIQRKDKQATLMLQNMIMHTQDLTKKELGQMERTFVEYLPEINMELPKWIK